MSGYNKDPRDIIIRPIVSEKSYALIDMGSYTFEVDPRATKTEVKLAIEKIFGVKVERVNTLNRVGKTRRTRFQSLHKLVSPNLPATFIAVFPQRPDSNSPPRCFKRRTLLRHREKRFSYGVNAS